MKVTGGTALADVKLVVTQIAALLHGCHKLCHNAVSSVLLLLRGEKSDCTISLFIHGKRVHQKAIIRGIV